MSKMPRRVLTEIDEVRDLSPAHTDLYTRVLEAVREDRSLDDLDSNLFPGFSPTIAEPAWERNKALVCTSLIQLVERVFLIY